MGLFSRRNATADAPPAISAEVSGEISGQLAVGSHIVQVSAAHGAIVNVAAPAQRARVRPRSAPAALLPRDFPGLIGRERTLADALRALADGEPVELRGEPGAGKTSVLRRLTHRIAERPNRTPDGIVFTRGAGLPVADLLQFLWESLYESDVPYLPTAAELRGALSDRRATAVLDDLTLDRDELGELLDALPGCAVVVAGATPQLWGEGRPLVLHGLATDDAVALVERHAGRLLDSAERVAVAALSERVGGQPLALVQAGAQLRDAFADGPLPGDPAAAAEGRLNPAEAALVGTLNLLAPAAVHVDDLAVVTAVPDAETLLDGLRARGAAESHSPRWTATVTTPSRARPSTRYAVPLAAALSIGAADRPVEDVPVVLAALQALWRVEAWDEAVALTRSADPLLTLGRRWGAWERALETARRAAVVARRPRDEAWALHQLGTRAALLDGFAAGAPLLAQALQLRRELGDEAGARVTEHNLAVFGGDGGAPPDGDGGRPPLRPAPLLALGGALVLGAGIAAALVLDGGDDEPAAGLSVAADTTVAVPAGAAGHAAGSGRPAVAGGAAVARLTVPPSVDFGEASVRVQQHRTVTATSSGSGAVEVASVTAGAPFSVTATDCVTTLAPGDSCTVEVRFAPTPETAGPQSGTLAFAGPGVSVALTGRAPDGASTPTPTGTVTAARGSADANAPGESAPSSAAQAGDADGSTDDGGVAGGPQTSGGSIR